MKERPILFSAPMIRALLAGTKTQTRRVLKHQPTARHQLYSVTHGGSMVVAAKWIPNTGDDGPNAVLCPYGFPGDRLWVKESWRVGKPHDHRSPSAVVERMREHETLGPRGVTVLYEAGGWKSAGPAGRDEPVYPDDEPMPNWAGKKRPSIFMPRPFSRITLEVTEVRVERLKDISRGDAMDEGCPFANMAAGPDPRHWYADLWNQINGAGSWDANPWVWVVTFKRVAAIRRTSAA